MAQVTFKRDVEGHEFTFVLNGEENKALSAAALVFVHMVDDGATDIIQEILGDGITAVEVQELATQLKVISNAVVDGAAKFVQK